MIDVAVIDDPTAAEVSLDPVRARLLAALAEPGSASTLAGQVGLSRQKINYHLHALERHGLVELVEERRKGNCIERVMRATAATRRLSTFGIDTEIRFASAADRAAFAEELASTVTTLVGRYHDETAEGGRWHRLVVALHPSITRDLEHPADDDVTEED